MRCLLCPPGADECPTCAGVYVAPSMPKDARRKSGRKIERSPVTLRGFQAVKSRPDLESNVRAGRHPLGFELLDQDMSQGLSRKVCGNCRDCDEEMRGSLLGNVKPRRRCFNVRARQAGDADVRKSWPACERWRNDGTLGSDKGGVAE